MNNVVRIPVSIPAANEAPEPVKPPAAERQGQALLALIEFFGEHDELPEQPYVILHGSDISAGKADLSWFLNHDEGGLELAIATRRAIGGRWTKQVAGDVVYLRQQAGPLALTITVAREQACTRRVVGTREVTVPEQPAVPAKTVTVEDVEWDCHPLLDASTI